MFLSLPAVRNTLAGEELRSSICSPLTACARMQLPLMTGLRQDPSAGRSAPSGIVLTEEPDSLQEKPPVPTLGPYILETLLARGSFATVCAATCAKPGRLHPEVAIKMTRRGGADETRARREVEIIRCVQNATDGVVRVIDTVESAEWFGMVMEKNDGIDLLNWCMRKDSARLKHTTEDFELVKSWFVQIAKTVAKIHELGYVHGDLKLENVLISKDKKTARLCDFGLSRRIDSSEETPAGTDEYISPEVIMSESKSARRFKTDVWALGVMLYSLVYQKMPFVRRPGQTRGSLLSKIAQADIKFPLEIDGTLIPDIFRKLLPAMLKRLPDERLNIQQVLAFIV